MRRTLLLIAVGLAGCHSQPPRPPGPYDPDQPYRLPAMPDIQRQVLVTTSTSGGGDSCAAAEALIEDQLVQQMRVRMEPLKNGPLQWPDWGDGGYGGGMDGGSEGSPAPGGFSTTNVQTPGVEEADLVKNDGSRIFTLGGQRLHLLRSWPADQLAVEASVDIEGTPRELLLASANQVVVFSVTAAATSKATIIDVTNLADPQVEAEVYLPGRYLSARQVGSAIRVVLVDWLPEPPGMVWYRSGSYQTRAELVAAIDEMEAANEALIRARPLSYWLPDAQVRGEDGQLHTSPHACEKVSSSNTSVTPGTTTVATLDPQNPAALDRWTMLGEASLVYASATSLYLASPHWWWWGMSPFHQNATYVHRFDISQPGSVSHVASGTVEGHLVNQLAMDEHQGKLRLALTRVMQIPTPTPGDAGMPAPTPMNRVVVLQPQGSELVEVGRTPNFAPWERIQSARFLGTRGFVVTFRQIDPLFTVDLTDPAHPAILGELEVPGFSSYLHVVDETRILGVGFSATRSAQVSLFDVSDLSQPQVTAVLPIGDASEAQRDHRAFTWLPASHLFAVPASGWSWTPDGWMQLSELKVFEVGGPGGLSERGTLSLTDLNGGMGWPDAYIGSLRAVRRSVLTSTHAFAISPSAARAAPLVDLDQPVATTLMDIGLPDGGYGFPDGGYWPPTDGGSWPPTDGGSWPPMDGGYGGWDGGSGGSDAG